MKFFLVGIFTCNKFSKIEFVLKKKMNNLKSYFSNYSLSSIFSSSTSLSTSNNINTDKKIFDLKEEIDDKWEIDESSIIGIKFLARSLGGFGALHTALLFETNSEYVVFEYGDCGLLGRYFPKSKVQVKNIYGSIMGVGNTVDLWNLTECFGQNLKLKDVYKVVDIDLKNKYKNDNYNILSHNCRHFTQELGQKIGCNEQGSVFLSKFRVNLFYLFSPLVNNGLSQVETLKTEKFYVGKYKLDDQ